MEVQGESPSRARFGHANHVMRAAALFVSGLAIFLVARRAMVPSDFGVYGFYRAGALADAAARPLAFAGQAACFDCHDAIVAARSGGAHERIGCEACHGPLARHASGDADVKPKELSPRHLCLTCHLKSAGRPGAVPQILPSDHAPEGPCTACHLPHNPRIG
jgi:hypothetical protein